MPVSGSQSSTSRPGSYGQPTSQPSSSTEGSNLGSSAGSTICDPLVDPLRRHPFLCTVYQSCVNGVWIDLPCPPGLVWNDAYQSCDWPESSNCIEVPIESQPSPNSTTIQSPTPTTVSSSSNNPEISLKPTRPTTTVSSTTQSTTGPTTRPRPTTTTTKRPSTSTTQTAVIPPIVVNPIKPGSGSSVTNTGNSQLYH